MAGRVLLSKAAAPLTATLLAGAIAFAPTVTYAETLDCPDKKPIYDDDLHHTPAPSKDLLPSSTTATTTSSSQPILLLPSPTPKEALNARSDPALVTSPRRPTPTGRLALQMRSARLALHHHVVRAEDSLNAFLTRAFALEACFTDHLASLAPPRESGERLVPGLVYILVSSMAGSIFARRRNFLVRSLTPPAVGLAAAWYFVPVTMGNVSGLVWRWEQRVPVVAEAHLRIREGVKEAVILAKTRSDLAVRTVENSVMSARGAGEGWVAKGK